jgi:addiction module RelB/DinJ family antitoxin
MANTALIQAKIDPALKRRAQKCLAGFGMDFSTAIRVYLQKIIQTRSIPFKIGEDEAPPPVPNARFARTLAAIDDDILNGRNLSPKMEAKEALAYLDGIESRE